MDEEVKSKPGMLKLGKTGWIITISLLIIGGLLLWKNISEKRLVKNYAEKEQSIIEKANLQLKANRSQTMDLVHMTLVWAIRSEMLRGNMEAVDQYIIQFVKEKDIEQVLLADPSGKILLSSDKKLEGKTFSNFYPSIILDANKSMVVDRDSTSIYVFGPVMGLSKKLGTLLFISSAKPFKGE